MKIFAFLFATSMQPMHAILLYSGYWWFNYFEFKPNHCVAASMLIRTHVDMLMCKFSFSRIVAQNATNKLLDATFNLGSGNE